MNKHLEEVIETFGQEISGIVSSPEQHHHFTVNIEAEKIDEEMSKCFTP